MAKTKDGKNRRKSTATSDGKRQETKEERAARLKSQAESREKCFQLLPIVGGVVAVFLLAFAIYVHNIPPKVITTIPANSTLTPETMAKLGPEALDALANSGIISKVAVDGSTFGEPAATTAQAATTNEPLEINLDDIGEEIKATDEEPMLVRDPTTKYGKKKADNNEL